MLRAASRCVLLPGLPHLGLEHRAAWVEAEADGTVTSMVSRVESIRSAIRTPRSWRCCLPRSSADPVTDSPATDTTPCLGFSSLPTWRGGRKCRRREAPVCCPGSFPRSKASSGGTENSDSCQRDSRILQTRPDDDCAPLAGRDGPVVRLAVVNTGYARNFPCGKRQKTFARTLGPGYYQTRPRVCTWRPPKGKLVLGSKPPIGWRSFVFVSWRK